MKWGYNNLLLMQQLAGVFGKLALHAGLFLLHVNSCLVTPWKAGIRCLLFRQTASGHDCLYVVHPAELQADSPRILGLQSICLYMAGKGAPSASSVQQQVLLISACSAQMYQRTKCMCQESTHVKCKPLFKEQVKLHLPL